MTTDKLRLIPAAEARRLLAEAVAPLAERERVPLAAAAGRVLAEPLVASEDVPAFPRSAMDGYAVRAADVAGASEAAPRRLALAGSIAIGEPPRGALGPGQAVAIPTGGAIPEAADAVVMIEHTRAEEAGRIAIGRAVAPGANIVRRGEDVRRGAQLLSAGRRLRPADVGLLAGFGVAAVPVYARARVAVLSSGSELIPPDAPATPPGKIRDSNQYVLGAQATAAGCAVTQVGIVDDDPESLESALRDLAAKHHVVVLSGGSSVGGRDFVGDVFARLGPPGILFHGIAIRPGRPTAVARAGTTLLCGLPGIPASALIVFEMFVRPALARLVGETEPAPWRLVRARLGAALASARGREDYVRVRLAQRQGAPWADPLPSSSQVFSTLSEADGLLVIGEDQEALAAGAEVDVRLLV